MSSARARVLELAAALGCDVEIGGGRNFTVSVDAPAGRRFVREQLHGLVAEARDLEPAAAAWRDLLGRLEGETLEPCACADCLEELGGGS